MAGWNNEEEFVLFNLYERFPVLWNSEDFNYHNLVKKHQAWRDIATNLDKSVEEVQKKIRSMKNLFRWEEAQMKKLSQTEEAQEQDHNRSSIWPALEKMEFSMYGYEQRKQVGSEKINISTGDRGTDDEDNTQYENNGKTPDSPTLVNEIHSGTPISETIRPHTASPPSGSSSMNSSTNCSKECLMEDPATTSCCNMFNYASGFPMTDECDDFGSYVAGKLKNFDRRTRAKMEHKITSILLDGELNRSKLTYFSDSSAASSASSSPHSPPRCFISTHHPPSSTPIKRRGHQSSHSFHHGTLFPNNSPALSPTFSEIRSEF